MQKPQKILLLAMSLQVDKTPYKCPVNTYNARKGGERDQDRLIVQIYNGLLPTSYIRAAGHTYNIHTNVYISAIDMLSIIYVFMFVDL
jgi:hypothetical protein